jgi:hypothetical protein
MTTQTDLRDAFTHLADLAPTRAVLKPPRPARLRPPVRPPRRMPGRRPNRMPARLRLMLAAATVLLLAVALPILVHRLRADQPPAGPAPASPSPAGPTPAAPIMQSTPATFPTAYVFGPSSIAGYELTEESLRANAQTFHFTNAKTHAQVTLSALPATAANNRSYNGGAPVTIGNRKGFFVVVRDVFTTPTVAWKLSGTRWATVSGTKSGSQTSLTKAQLLNVATSVRVARDDHAALVVVGHLPDHMRFDLAAVYRDQGMMAAPDLYIGTGYRCETFVDRRPGNMSSFDIVSVYDPFQPLSKATPKTLPSFENGPWTKTTVRGHLAWTAPHDVLIQWGPILIDLNSNRPDGNTTIQLVSRKDLLDVAASLTVPTSNLIGAGFPLGTSVPAGTIE